MAAPTSGQYCVIRMSSASRETFYQLRQVSSAGSMIVLQSVQTVLSQSLQAGFDLLQSFVRGREDFGLQGTNAMEAVINSLN